jgi:hypothetical protein
MQISSWLNNTTAQQSKMLGINSFSTFLKVCSEFADWALDDSGLANRNSAYKIWTCRVPYNKLTKVKSILEQYTSMQLLLHYYNKSIIENSLIALYIKLDWLENKWVMSYGITDNRKLYKTGEFDFTINTKLPDNEILKYIKPVINDFDARRHIKLYKIKQLAYMFNPGYCQIFDPVIVDNDIVISTKNLGVWIDNNTLHNGEAISFLNIFKTWVKQFQWASEVELIIRPKRNKVIDFVIRLIK